MIEASSRDSAAFAAGGEIPVLAPAENRQLLKLPAGSVAGELFESPWKFDFFEAVLLLQQFANQGDATARHPVGGFAPPSDEAVRFTVPHDCVFPNASMNSIGWDAEAQRSTVCITFLGLTGPSGIMPRSYTERLAQIDAVGRHSERHALRDWLDNFNHRIASLFFEAWTKYRYPVTIRRRLGEPSRHARPPLIRVALAALGGLDSSDRLPLEPDLESTSAKEDATHPRPQVVDRDELLGLAGVLAQRPMNAANLQAAAEQCLGVPVRVKQFEGCWLDLERESRTCLGGRNCELGHDTLIGERIWSRQQKICIEIGPLTADDFDRFLPPSEGHVGDGYCRLVQLVTTSIGSQLGFDLRPLLRVDEEPQVKLGGDATASRLGLDSWLGKPAHTRVADDAIFSGTSG